MGFFLALVHQVLREYLTERVPQRSFVFDSAATLVKMDMLEGVIRSRPVLDEVDTQALAQLLRQRKLLTTSVGNVPSLARLEQQVIHGDYQEANLFFEKDKVSAIIDWDQSYVAPRAWEVVRTLDYAFNLDATLCRSFLHAYRTVQPLPQEDVNIAAENYGFKRMHDVWVYATLYSLPAPASMGKTSSPEQVSNLGYAQILAKGRTRPLAVCHRRGTTPHQSCQHPNPETCEGERASLPIRWQPSLLGKKTPTVPPACDESAWSLALQATREMSVL